MTSVPLTLMKSSVFFAPSGRSATAAVRAFACRIVYVKAFRNNASSGPLLSSVSAFSALIRLNVMNVAL